MTHVFAELIDERLCQHQAIMLNPEWSRLAGLACDTLHDLYQAIGQEHMDQTARFAPPPNPAP